MSTPPEKSPAPVIMEQITPRLRKCGNAYELDGEDFRRVVGRPSWRNSLDVAWDLREFAVSAGVDMSADDDNPPDEPIRRTVGQTRPR